MKWMEIVVAEQVRLLANQLHRRLKVAPEGSVPIFRDRTVRKLTEAIKEAGEVLKGTPVAGTLSRLAEVMMTNNNISTNYPGGAEITAQDLRDSRLLREEISECCRLAAEEIDTVLYYNGVAQRFAEQEAAAAAEVEAKP